MTTKPEAKRQATSAELSAAMFLAAAMVVLAGSLIQRRLENNPKPSSDELSGRWIVPGAEQEGVVVTPGGGHLLSVDSTPAGANVLFDGALLGQTPFSSDFSCEAEKRSVLELKKAGFKTARFELECVTGSTRVKVKLKALR